MFELIQVFVCNRNLHYFLTIESDGICWWREIDRIPSLKNEKKKIVEKIVKSFGNFVFLYDSVDQNLCWDDFLNLIVAFFSNWFLLFFSFFQQGENYSGIPYKYKFEYAPRWGRRRDAFFPSLLLLLPFASFFFFRVFRLYFEVFARLSSTEEYPRQLGKFLMFSKVFPSIFKIILPPA